MSKHTPGPWFVWGNLIRTSENERDGETIASLLGCVQPRETKRANARLIAAAPRMLDALQAVANDIIERGEVSLVTCTRVSRAIVLAKNDQPASSQERDKDENAPTAGEARCADCGVVYKPVWKLNAACPLCGPPQVPDGRIVFRYGTHDFVSMQISSCVAWIQAGRVVVHGRHPQEPSFIVNSDDAARVAAAFGLPWPAEGGMR